MSNKRVTEIEQQMAHLEWLKAQNERAYRNTMEKTRVMHQNDIILKMAVDANSEKAGWMKSVIRDELSKPLVLSDAELFEFSRKVERDQVMLNKRSENHLRSVTNLKRGVNSRIERNSSTREFLDGPLQTFGELESTIASNLESTKKIKSPIKGTQRPSPIKG